MSPYSFSEAPSLLQNYLKLIEDVNNDDDFEIADEAEQDLQNWIMEPFRRIFERTIPALRHIDIKCMTGSDNTVKKLHKIGDVRGDANAANVSIDRNDDAWVIDFAGRFTEAWVDKSQMETIKGDLTGLAKIEDSLRGEEHRQAADY